METGSETGQGELRRTSAVARNGRRPWISTALNAVAAIGGKRLLDELEGGRPHEESPKESRLGRMFADFQIGSEEVLGGGVPFLVLGEIGLKTLLVLRSCLLGSFSERTGRKIRSSTFFRWGIDFPLRGLYGAWASFEALLHCNRQFLPAARSCRFWHCSSACAGAIRSSGPEGRLQHPLVCRVHRCAAGLAFRRVLSVEPFPHAGALAATLSVMPSSLFSRQRR